jgi:hypothetical protein
VVAYKGFFVVFLFVENIDRKSEMAGFQCSAMFTIRPNGKIFLLSISLKPLYNLEENLPV